MITIFGKSNCPYCINAKELADKIKKYANINYEYIDIEDHKISKKDLSKKIGKPISTVPQIIINNKYIGGYTDFKLYANKNIFLKE